ncbi:MAG: DUF364 domain-containing protein [Anaerolineales bacterium]|jgi:hypothetical protein
MALLDDLLSTLPHGTIQQVVVGIHWTTVVAEVKGERRCGLASTLMVDHDHHRKPDVPQAGQLETQTSSVLASLAKSDHPTQRSIGVAAINALLPPTQPSNKEQNAENVIAKYGSGKKVILVGRFPFIPRLRDRIGELIVLERNPQPGELSDTAAKDVIPSADVVAITGMTLINHTLENLLSLCSPQAVVILLGPSTPLSPIFFDYGVHLLCGSVVTAIESVLSAVGQGANFRQVHQAGVRLVSITSPGFNLLNTKRDIQDESKIG